VRWQILLHLLLQFNSACNSEGIIKIGQSLPKLAQKVCVSVTAAAAAAAAACS